MVNQTCVVVFKCEQNNIYMGIGDYYRVPLLQKVQEYGRLHGIRYTYWL